MHFFSHVNKVAGSAYQKTCTITQLCANYTRDCLQSTHCHCKRAADLTIEFINTQSYLSHLNKQPDIALETDMFGMIIKPSKMHKLRVTMGFIQNPKCQIILWSIISFFAILVSFSALMLHIYLPRFVQKIVYDLGSDPSPPNCFIDMNMFSDDAFYFNVTKTFDIGGPFFVKTRVEEPIQFRTKIGNKHVLIGQIPTFPDLEWGPNTPFLMESYNFTYSLNNSQQFGELWKRWFDRAFLPDTRPSDLEQFKVWSELKEETTWNISSVVGIEIFGFKFAHIPVYTLYNFSGGMSAGGGTSSPKFVNTDSYSISKMEANLTLQYNNSGRYSIYLGSIKCSLSSVYFPNNTDTSTVLKIGDFEIPDFHYVPGVHNINLDTSFFFREGHLISNSEQIITNYIFNRTTRFQITDIETKYPWKPKVPWLEHALSSLHFDIPVSRHKSLIQVMKKGIGSGMHVDFQKVPVSTID